MRKAAFLLAFTLARGAEPVDTLLSQARTEKDSAASVSIYSKALAAARGDAVMSLILARERLARMADAPDAFPLESLINALDEVEGLARRGEYLFEMRRVAAVLADKQPKVAIEACRRGLRFLDDGALEESGRYPLLFLELKALVQLDDKAAAARIAEALLRNADSLSAEEEAQARTLYAKLLEQNGDRLASASQRSVNIPKRRMEASRQIVLSQTMSVKAPAFHLVSLQGDPVSLSDYLGKPVVLAFWASWCKPCEEELPALQRAMAKWPGVTVLAISVDEKRQQAEAFVRRHGITLPVLMADASAQDAYEADTLPKLYVVDGKGMLRFRRAGSSPVTELEQHLGWMLEAVRSTASLRAE